MDILLSDDLLTKFQTFKGIFFVVITTLLLYVFVKKNQKQIKINNKYLKKKNKDLLLVREEVKVTNRELEEALIKVELSEEKYRNWFEYFPHATFIWAKKDDDFVMVQANKKAYHESDNKIENIFGIKSRILWKNEPDLTEYLVECYRTHETKSIERQYKFRANGKEQYTSTTYSFIPPDSIQIITVDITKQKQADDELRNQKKLFETMFNTITDGVIITDPDRNILLANKGMKTTFGYEPDELIGKNTELLYYDTISYIETGKNVFNVGSSLKEDLYISHYKDRNGVNFPGETFGCKLYDSEGKRIGNLGIMRNVSERQKMIYDLIEAKEKAEESEKLKSAFLQNMSHEIRTPLNAISGFSGLLSNNNLSDEKRTGFISIIQNSSKQLISIVNDILTISSLETNQLKPVIEKVSINEIIIELFEIFKQQAQNSNISIHKQINLTNEQSVIYTDKTKIIQILSNLISNAFKFTNKGSIEFGYTYSNIIENNTSKNGFLRFYVKDTGIGIQPYVQEKIFERFRQADNSIAKKYGGTGLGLSISKAFVELLGGKIWLESQPDIGSTFFFTIPYKPVN